MTIYGDRTGRDVFLSDLLPNAEKISRQIIIRELFENHERILWSQFDIFGKYDRLRNADQFQVKGGAYILQTIEVLQCFHEDVALLNSIEPKAWDKGILEDALNLLRFQMEFLSKFTELKKICMNEGNKTKVLDIGGVKNWGDAAERLEEVQNALSTVVIKFQEKHGVFDSQSTSTSSDKAAKRSGSDKTTSKFKATSILDSVRAKDKSSGTTSTAGMVETKLLKDYSWRDMVSTVTLRELFILNQISTMKYLTSPPKYRKAVSDKVLEEIERIKVLTSQNMPERKVPATDNVHAWRPRTIVVFYDSKSKLFHTGASQPACDRFVFWDELTKPITRHRVGEKFARIIDGLATSFNEQAQQIKRRKNDQINLLHNFYNSSAPGKDISSKIKKNADVTQIYNKLVKREPTNGDEITLKLTVQPSILCFAFDGFSLKPKAPCIRCQYMYPGWNHNRMPSTPKEKIDSIHTGMSDSSVTSRPKETGTSGPFSYCAESVAAAKLHLLRNGKLVLA